MTQDTVLLPDAHQLFFTSELFYVDLFTGNLNLIVKFVNVGKRKGFPKMTRYLFQSEKE